MKTEPIHKTGGTKQYWHGHGKGFTLPELMITLAIAAILLSVGIPSFRSFILNQRVKTATSDIFYTLTLARSEAIKRNALVTVTQAAAGWQAGWTVTTGTTTLSTQVPYKNLTITNAANSVSYGGDGRVTAAATTKFQISGGSSPRCITIDLSGLPKSINGACP